MAEPAADAQFYFEKTVTEVFDAKVELAPFLGIPYEGEKVYATNDQVRPPRATGFAYKATTNGQTRSRPPVWPLVLGGTIVDGSVIWEAVFIGTANAATIASTNVPAVAGITLGAESTSGTRVTIRISDGTLGVTYRISLEVTTSTGEVVEAKIDVYIKSE